MRAGGASPKRMTRLLATGVLIAFYCFGLAMAATFSPAQARGRGGALPAPRFVLLASARPPSAGAAAKATP